jgi:hypothetical protein
MKNLQRIRLGALTLSALLHLVMVVVAVAHTLLHLLHS